MKGTQKKAASRPNPKSRPCEFCRPFVETPSVLAHSIPLHLVHPQTGKPNMYDVHGHAICRNCGTKYHRGPRGLRVVE